MPGNYEALMMDYAAGALWPAAALVVDAHVRLKPEAGRLARALEIAGGMLLERHASAPLTAAPLVSDYDPAAGRRGERGAMREARALTEAAAAAPEALRWRTIGWGVRERRLPIKGASLLAIKGGSGAPHHGHEGLELTLVLRGGFDDGLSHYARGDLSVVDDATQHRPRADAGEECVCLVARQGGQIFTHWAARLASRALQAWERTQ